MSGHSKWAKIKHSKGLTDAKRGKVFTRHAKLVAIAAQRGADPVMNPSLRVAIDNAKAENVPNANIDKAIRKGAGLDKDAVHYEEMMYEAFGPKGTSLFIHVITDNKNRSLAEIKSILVRNNGAMAAAGSAAWVFETKGVITIPAKGDVDELQLKIIDAGADDIKQDGDTIEVYTEAAKLTTVRDNLKNSGVEIESAKITLVPKQTVKIDDIENAEKVLRLIDAVDEHEDVADVYCNFDMDNELIEKMG